MNRAVSLMAGVLVCWLSAAAAAQEPEIEQALRDAGAEVRVYKQATNAAGDQVDLNMYIFNPPDLAPGDRRPAIVFFFGGGWRGGRPSQFTEHCRHLASRGMVAMTADYRVSSRHQTKAIHCVADGKDAVRWIRKHADELGVDPKRVAAGGGSAGGHVAACTGVVKYNEQLNQDPDTSGVPDALVLFNPALVLAALDGKPPLDPEKLGTLQDRVGADPVLFSPTHQVAPEAPPTIIFHGTADTTVPYWTAEAFTEAMNRAGNACRLVGYEGEGHGFFNHGREGNVNYEKTVAEMDAFFVSLGWLEEPAD